jgi:hypothetical protein
MPKCGAYASLKPGLACPAGCLVFVFWKATAEPASEAAPATVRPFVRKFRRSIRENDFWVMKNPVYAASN